MSSHLEENRSPDMDPKNTLTPPERKPIAAQRPYALIVASVTLTLGLLGAAFFFQQKARRGPDGRAPDVTQGAPSAASELLAKVRPPAQPSAKPSLEPASSERELEEIQKLFRSIPRSWRDAPDVSKLRADVKGCRDRCEAFLSSRRGGSSDHEVEYILARLALSLNQVEWSNYVNRKTQEGWSNQDFSGEFERWAAAYFGRIQDLAKKALEKAPRAWELRGDCLDVLADALLQGKKPAESLERYRQLLAEFPSYPDLASVYLAMANAHQELGQFGEGVSLLRKGLVETPDDPSFPYYYESLWKLYTSAGDLPGLLKAVEEMRSILPERERRQGIGKHEAEICERLFAMSGFRLGYTRFALGDHAGAAQAFREHIAFLDSLESALKLKNRSLPQDYQIYRDFRSRDNLEALENRVGRPPSGDLRSALWAWGRKPALDGRPVALVLRPYGDDRSAQFLKAFDRHARGRAAAFELVVLSSLKGEDNPEGQLAEASEELQKLGVDCPVGLDPDARDKGLYRAFAAPGSATFVILDRAGNYAWFQQDPRGFDARFSIAIVERICEDK